MKPGLWEITLTVRTSGVPAMTPELIAKLTPEERARMEAKIKEEAAGGSHTTVKKRCLNEKELRQPLTLNFGGGGEGCHQTVTTATRTKQEIRVDCQKGGGGTIRIEVANPENAKVLSNWSAITGSHTLKMNSTATLRWLGAECEPLLADTTVPAPAKPAPAPPAPAKEDAGHYYKTGKEQTDKGDFWAALKSFNRAIELDPNRAAYYNARGYVYLRLQSYANAAVEFSTAIRLRADYANAYRNRAIAKEHLNDHEGAAADNRTAAELEKHH